MSGVHAGAGAVKVSNVEMLSSGTTQAGTQGVLARVIPSAYLSSTQPDSHIIMPRASPEPVMLLSSACVRSDTRPDLGAQVTL